MVDSEDELPTLNVEAEGELWREGRLKGLLQDDN